MKPWAFLLRWSNREGSVIHRVQGHPGQGVQGEEFPLPAGGLAVERYLKEPVSKRGRRAGCPLTNPRGLQSEWCGLVEPSTPVPQNGSPLCTTVPHKSASGGKGLPP
ncbi:hypothetical protein VT03_14630 [Planctomyces sp. SH-PL14]|nr:hypothetical protein VT03_14630 [Planctomyces sp. SH-PL14]